MKVNKFGMLIKFAVLYVFMSLIVVSANPLGDTKSDKKAASGEDYDATSLEKSTESSSSDTKPPLFFPDDEKSISKNVTVLEILQKNSNTSVVNDETASEKDTNKSTTVAATVDESIDKDYDEKQKDSTDKDTKTAENNEEKAAPQKTVEEVTKKNETEQEKKDEDYDSIENTGDDKEDAENIQESQDQGDLEEKYGVNSTTINVFEEPKLRGPHIAFIFATSLVFLSATAYVGLIIWRKTLERRYGMRQRLVTEDDYYNNNDVRFFGL